MMKNILIGLGVLSIGGLIYKAKKEQEFNNNINDITRRTGEQIVRDMERMNQETINNINNQQFMNSMM